MCLTKNLLSERQKHWRPNEMSESRADSRDFSWFHQTSDRHWLIVGTSNHSHFDCRFHLRHYFAVMRENIFGGFAPMSLSHVTLLFHIFTSSHLQVPSVRTHSCLGKMDRKTENTFVWHWDHCPNWRCFNTCFVPCWWKFYNSHLIRESQPTDVVFNWPIVCGHTFAWISSIYLSH